MALTGTYRHTSKRVKRNIPLEEYEALKNKRSKKVRFKAGKFSLGLNRVRAFGTYVLLALSAVFLLGLANGYQHQIPCRSVEFNIHTGIERQFLNEDDLRMLVELEYGRDLVGAKLDEIKLQDLEAGINQIPYIEKAEVYKTLMGVVHIEAWFRKPIARMVTDRGNHIYIDENGNKFPVSKRQSANVLLIRGTISERLLPTDSLKQEGLAQALPVINFISKHDFWNAQLSEMILDEKGNMEFTPLVGNTRIEFGKAERLEDKFHNLRLFYDQVLSKGAWNDYRNISVKFKGQVKTRMR